MKSKYYILKRTSISLIDSYYRELPIKKQSIFRKQLDYSKPLILVEKAVNSDHTEVYTNAWLLDESCDEPWYKITKGRVMYDYTGICYPLVHVNGEVRTFKQYGSKLQL
jgi:hypothetical protein